LRGIKVRRLAQDAFDLGAVAAGPADRLHRAQFPLPHGLTKAGQLPHAILLLTVPRFGQVDLGHGLGIRPNEGDLAGSGDVKALHE